MIDFRYHVISLVAIFFALAAGVALGAGPLQGTLTEGLADRAEQDRLDKEQLRAELESSQDRISFADSYAGDTAAAVLGSSLAGRPVSLLTLPGADLGDVRALREAVIAADGTVVSTVSLTQELLDPANRQLAEGLAQQVLDGVDGVSAPDGAVSYELMGAAIARAFLTRNDQPVVQDNDANSIEAALTEAGFIAVDSEVDRRAELAIVVGGDPAADAPEGQPEVAAEIAGAMDAGALGTVVAGTAASARAGVVQAVRDGEVGDEVSSVDVVDLTAGRVVTVLALSEQGRAGVGHYGQTDAEDGAVPDRTTAAGTGGS